MNLSKRRELAAKVLKVGKDRIIFMEGHLGEVKEAITRQDILDLYKAGAILVKDVKGRRKVKKRKNRRRVGKVKKKVNNRKKEYVIITRKLRGFVRGLVRAGKIDVEKKRELRRQIRARRFRSKRHLKEHLEEI